MSSENNFYILLGLERDATADEIRQAYRDAVRRLHPDAHPNDPTALERFLQVQKAYETLNDAKKRLEYDKTLPQEPEIIRVNALYSRSYLPPLNEPQLLYIKLDFQAPENVREIPPPTLNIALVLDRSTSMQGPRLDMVKTTAIELTRQLKPQDILSIIAFSDRADVLLQASTQIDQSRVENAIRLLQAGGGTEIYQGLRAGYNEIQRYYQSRFVNHIILITDGRTYGDEEHCLRLTDQARKQGIGISGLGIGHEWNDSFIDQITSRTGGDTVYVARPKHIQDFLSQKFSRLGQTYAENVVLSIEPNPQAKLLSAFRLQPEAGPIELNGGHLLLGSIPKKAALSVLLEFRVESIASQNGRISITRGYTQFSIPGANLQTHKRRLHLHREISTRNEPDLPQPEIMQALSKLTLYHLQEKAQHDVKAGKFQEATQRLQNLATHLLAQGETELAQTVMIEARNIYHTHALSAEGSKQIKYGTRSLLLPAHSGSGA